MDCHHIINTYLFAICHDISINIFLIIFNCVICEMLYRNMESYCKDHITTCGAWLGKILVEDLSKLQEKYKTFQIAHSPEMITEVMELAGKNITNNRENVLKEIEMVSNWTTHDKSSQQR